MTELATTPSGRITKVVGIALIVAGGLLYVVLGGPDDNPNAFVGVLLMLGGMLAYFRGRRQAAKITAESPNNPTRATKANVLYLRSFKTDTSTPFKILMSGFTTEEEQLADVLRPFGDMITIGRPGERLPLPGAVRIVRYGFRMERRGAGLHAIRLPRRHQGGVRSWTFLGG
jgi:hypothetical protein